MQNSSEINIFVIFRIQCEVVCPLSNLCSYFRNRLCAGNSTISWWSDATENGPMMYGALAVSLLSSTWACLRKSSENLANVRSAIVWCVRKVFTFCAFSFSDDLCAIECWTMFFARVHASCLRYYRAYASLPFIFVYYSLAHFHAMPFPIVHAFLSHYPAPLFLVKP